MPSGRRGMPDAEKERRGTLDQRWSEDARADRKVVQLFKHPRLDRIPDPELPLSKEGRKKYRELAELLLESSQLTVVTRGYAEMAAIAFEAIADAKEKGKSISASLIKQYNDALGNIRQFDVDKKVSPDGQRKNKFRHTGFASRSRLPVSDNPDD